MEYVVALEPVVVMWWSLVLQLFQYAVSDRDGTDPLSRAFGTEAICVSLEKGGGVSGIRRDGPDCGPMQD